jgi:rod shape determining protein RodA
VGDQSIVDCDRLGGWSGKGFKAPNTQIELGFLPATAVHNDYIFSAVAEQWGFVGGIILISAFALLLLTCLFVAFSPETN